ncbi:MAG: type II secretion system protein GspM [Gammaproteobacteria bacterium]|nr:type II secretion system protein GspM [Gammaproteobacteria bacterium]
MIALRRVSHWFRGRSPRERWLVVGSALAVLLLVGDQLVWQPLSESHQRVLGEQHALQTAVRTQQEEMARLQARLGEDPNAAPRRTLDRLEREIAAFDRQIAEVTSQLIEPGEMSRVLEAMLSRVDRLKLVALENLEPEPLKEEADAASATGAFRHGLRIELEGRFRDAVDYLALLETLPWGFFWERLEIVAGEYPVNRITVEIYTVTVGREWLGV